MLDFSAKGAFVVLRYTRDCLASPYDSQESLYKTLLTPNKWV